MTIKRFFAAFFALCLLLAPAADARLVVNQLSGFGVSQAEGFSLTYLTNSGDTSNLTTYTFSSVDLGDAAGDRLILVGSSGVAGAARAVSSVTVGGVSATQAAQASNGGQPAALHSAVVPTGATGDIVVTFNGSMNRAHIGVWRLSGYNSSTVEDTIGAGLGSSSSQTGTIDVSAGGVIIAYGIGNNTGNHGWTGVTENFDVTLESAHAISGASDVFESAETGRTITADPGSGSSTYGLVAGSWR